MTTSHHEVALPKEAKSSMTKRKRKRKSRAPTRTKLQEATRNDGRSLEDLVSAIEKCCLPPGLKIEPRAKDYQEGVQIAEFDLRITGLVGTTEFDWLIECRDRPSDGPAPGAWIEQLVGRRAAFGFHRVTAVSTTGFSPGAVELGKRCGIELRTINDVGPEQFQWR